LNQQLIHTFVLTLASVSSTSLLAPAPAPGSPAPISAPAPASVSSSSSPAPPPLLSLNLILEVSHLSVHSSVHRPKLTASAAARPTAIQLLAKITTDRLQMHEVAKSASGTFSHLVLPAAGLTEICYWCQLRVDRAPSKPAIVEVGHCLLRILLFPELDVDISHEMISKIVAYVHLLHLAILVVTLHKDILEEVVVVLLHLLVRHISEVGAVGRLGAVLWINVQVLEYNSLREGRFVVDSGAAVTMTAGTDLEEEATVHLVLLGTENTGQILGHSVVS